MKGTFVRAPSLNQDSDGNIFGIIVIKECDSEESATILGQLDKFPYKHDDIDAIDCVASSHPVYGKQYRAKYIHVSYPTDPRKSRSYMSSVLFSRSIPGFGAARKEAFLNAATWEMLNKPVEEWPDIHMITLDQKNEISKRFIEFDKARDPSHRSKETLFLVRAFLDQIGIKCNNDTAKSLATAIEDIGGICSSVEATIRNNLLKIIEMTNIEAKLIHKIAYSMECDEHILNQLSILVSLEQNETMGNTYMLIDGYDKELHALQTQNHIFITNEGQIFRRKTWEAENGCAKILGEAIAEPAEPAEPEPHPAHHYNNLQQEAISNAQRYKVSIVTGGPGTGKTTTMKGILLSTKARHCVILAPTGRAVARARETISEEGNGATDAMTIHRFLWRLSTEDISPPDLVIIDEASMMDIHIFYQLLTAIHYMHPSIVIIGDPDQLPSIGCGNVLKDLVDSGVIPHVSLTEVHRQEHGSRLLQAIQAIKCGEIPKYVKGSDYERIGIDGSDEFAFKQSLQAIAKQFCHQPQKILFVTPMNATIQRYSNTVREYMNPGSENNPSFAIGDRVIQCKNVYTLDVERFNGMMGTIKHIRRIERPKKTRYVNGIPVTIDESETHVYVDFDNGTSDRYTMTEANDQLRLGYILTVHKAQGSEADTIVYITEHYGSLPRILTRNLIYTAVSRGKKRCIILGCSKSYRNCIRTMPEQRVTMLSRLLRDTPKIH